MGVEVENNLEDSKVCNKMCQCFEQSAKCEWGGQKIKSSIKISNTIRCSETETNSNQVKILRAGKGYKLSCSALVTHAVHKSQRLQPTII